jgi:hypothetical protein
LSVLRIVRPVRLGLWGILGLLLLSTLVATGGVASVAPPSGSTPSSSAACAGSSIPTSYTGVVTVVGGPLNSSAAAGLNLTYNYSTDEKTVNRTTGTTISLACEALDGAANSGTNGTFALQLVFPSSHCTPTECITSSGSFGPLVVAPASGLPSGYDLRTVANGTSLSVTLVAELGGLTLNPGGTSRVLSTGDPVGWAVQAVNAVGEASPLSPNITWNLTGTGWTFVGPGAGSNVTLEALPGAGAGQLSVAASAWVGTNRFAVGPIVVTLVAVPTAFSGGDANRTYLDAGGAVSFTADGSGAAGYSYTALIGPGLGLAPVDWSCASSPSGEDTVSLACAGAVTYPSPGTADPSVQLTNTFSVGEGSLPSVTVSPPPAIDLSPGLPAGYSGSPISIRVSAIPGSGTTPYARACVAPGFGLPLCSTSPGPNWTFAPVYSTPGTYSALAWVIDREGTNASTSFAVAVVAPLSLSSIATSTPILADAPTSLSSQVTGGDVPLRFWWNASGTATPIATGVLDADGPVSMTWVPPLPGSVTLSFTVVDALGTLTSTSTLVTVGPAVASTVAEVVAPGAAPVTAGAPVAVVWQAEDLQGATVPAFSEAGDVEFTTSDGTGPTPVWVNASGVGALVEDAGGTFVIPTSAWNLGRLALTFTATHAAAYLVRLEGAGLLDRTVGGEVTVVADLAHLHLYDPTVLLAGARANRTFWRISDEYGNPALGAAVDILFQSGGTSNESIVPVVSVGPGATGVWVNYTSRTEAGGSLEVTETNSAGTVLLGPIAIPPASTGAPLLSAPFVSLATLAPVGAVGVGFTAWAQRRKRAVETRDDGPPEEELRRLVEGRDRVIALVRDARAIDLAGLESGWGVAPAPPELPDWVASLVADGTLGARTGPDGVARFCLVVSADGPPLILLDPDALERSAAARREMTEDPGPDAGRPD